MAKYTEADALAAVMEYFTMDKAQAEEYLTEAHQTTIQAIIKINEYWRANNASNNSN